MKDKEIKDMSNAELKAEWKHIENHHKYFGVGMKELMYKVELQREMEKRDL